MKTLAEETRRLFAEFPFGEPAKDSEIARAESLLGHSIPQTLRDLYASFDGFEGPTHARFMWSLFGKEGLVEFNQFLRAGEEFPRDFVSSHLFYGDDGCGPMWGVHLKEPEKIILWDAEWGTDFEFLDGNPLDVWRKCKAEYDDIDPG